MLRNNKYTEYADLNSGKQKKELIPMQVCYCDIQYFTTKNIRKYEQ
jgi:hypothetical protein